MFSCFLLVMLEGRGWEGKASQVDGFDNCPFGGSPFPMTQFPGSQWSESFLERWRTLIFSLSHQWGDNCWIPRKWSRSKQALNRAPSIRSLSFSILPLTSGRIVAKKQDTTHAQYWGSVRVRSSGPGRHLTSLLVFPLSGHKHLSQ